MKRPQLFFLHFAGGNYYSFQYMFSYLKDFELIPLELPGRGRRMKENLLKEFDKAAIDCYNQIITKLNSADFIIYGHSMGAYLALRVTNLLEKAHKIPVYLVVSGNAGPGIDLVEKRYLLGRDQFIEELRKLGGVPEEVLEHDELLDFLLPILRADFEIAGENGLESEPPVNTPIFSIMGDEEEHVKEISNWKRFTCASFDYKVMPGKHFFIFQHPCEIAKIIRYNYERVSLSRRKSRMGGN